MPIATIAGLDNFGNNGLDAFVSNCAIGTGTPTFDQNSTTLQSEFARTSSNGGFADSIVYTTLVKAGVTYLRRTRTFTRVINIATPQNFTEFGLFVGAAGGNASVIGRYRVTPNDENSALFTLVAQAGDQVQMVFREIEDIPYQLQAANMTITGLPGNDTLGTFAVNKTFYATSVAASPVQQAFNAWNPLGIAMFVECISLAGSTQTAVTVRPANVAQDTAFILQPYTNGSYFRDKLTNKTTAQSNAAIYGFVTYDIGAGGFKAHFTNPTTFTKLNTQTLAIRLRSSWSWN